MNEYTWVWGLGAFTLAAFGFVAGWIGRIMKGEAAMEVAKSAMSKAEAAESALAAFKTDVAREYASLTAMNAVEGRVVTAIEGLGGRLDRLVEILVTPAPPDLALRKPG